MKWCCPQLKGHLEEAGRRGFAVVPRAEGEDIHFLIQFRSFDEGDDVIVDLGVPFTLVSQTGLVFCPWCGVRLSRWYRRKSDDVLAAGRPDLIIDGPQPSSAPTSPAQPKPLHRHRTDLGDGGG